MRPTATPVKSGITTAAASVGIILTAIFGHEGGFVDNPDDPGGATNYGITEQVARDYGYDGPMKLLPKQVAQDILTEQYIVGPGFMPVVDADPALAHELIDIGVNAGPKRASCWFQEGLNSFNVKQTLYRDIKVDCDIGPATMDAYFRLRRARGPLACELMLKYLDGRTLGHYARLGRNNSRFETFMTGWVRTRIGNVDHRKCYTGEAG